MRAFSPLMLTMRPQPDALQVRYGRPCAAQRAHVLNVEVVQEILVNDGFDSTDCRSRTAWCGAAVDENLQAAELAGCIVDHRLDAGAIFYVAGERDYPSAGRSRDLCGGCREAVLIPGDDRDVDALSRQLQCDGLADAAAAAGDQSALSLES